MVMTIFDRILRKEIPCDAVYEDEKVLAFRDINPQAPVHVLVIPKQKLSGFDQVREASDTEIADYFKRVSMVAHKLGLEEGGYRIVFNCGSDGQQTVNYIHAHILGGRQLKWPPG